MAAPTYKGTPIPILTVPVNWKSEPEFTELEEVLVFEALDTSEERMGVQPRPLYGLRFRGCALPARGTAYIRRVIELAAALPIGVPLWPAQIVLTVAAAAGATTLTVDSTDDSLWEVQYDYALIYQDFETWEIIEVESLTLTELTLAAPLAGDWSADLLVIPLAFGKLTRGPHDQLTDERGVFEVDFEERWIPGLSHGRRETFYEVEPAALTMATCGEEFTLGWRGTAIPNWIQIAEDEGGPWYDYFEFLPSDEQFASQEYAVTINNSFAGERWFRILREDGKLLTSPVNPPAAELPLPELTIAGADLSERPLNRPKRRPGQPETELQFRPYTWRENLFINLYEVYSEASDRWEMYRGYNSFAHQIVATNAPDGESVVKWTRDGTDPTADTVNPTINGLANNAAAYRTDFGGVIKARCFNGECRGPLLTVILDKRVQHTQRLAVEITGGSARVACDLPWIDAFGNTIRSSNSCPEPTTEDYDFIACAAAEANPYVGTRERTFFLRTFSAENRALSGWDQYVPSSGLFEVSGATITRYPANFWDQAPVRFTNIIAADDAGHEGYFAGGFMTGPSGSAALAQAGVLSWMTAIATSTANDCRSVFIELNVAVCDVLVTPHDDFGTLVPIEGGDYGGDPTPPLPTPAGVYGDDFQTQPEGEIDETPSTYSGGTGLSGYYRFTTYQVVTGGDDFQGYTDGVITDSYTPEEGAVPPLSYNLGEGLSGAWNFRTSPAAVYGGDDFQGNTDGVIVDSGDNRISLPAIETGTRFTGPWGFIFRTFGGGDDFQTYPDGVIDEINDVLAGGTSLGPAWKITTYP